MPQELYHRRLMENPFYILGATPAHGGDAIRDLEASRLLIHGPELAAWAVAQLTHPATRLEAELGWVYDVPEDMLDGLLIGIEERSLEEIVEKCGALGPLDRIVIAMDLIASRRPDIGLSPLPWLIEAWSDLDAGPCRGRINELRRIAGEPEIGPETFRDGLMFLRSVQAAFIDGLLQDPALDVADFGPLARSFVLNESGRMADMAADAEPQAAKDVYEWPDAPSHADTAHPSPEEEQSDFEDAPVFGLFEDDTEAHEDRTGDDSDFSAHPSGAMPGYQDESVINAIMGGSDTEWADRSDEPADEEPELVPTSKGRRISPVLMGSGAGLLVLAVLATTMLSGGDEPPGRLAHTDGQPEIVLGQPQSSDAREKDAPRVAEPKADRRMTAETALPLSAPADLSERPTDTAIETLADAAIKAIAPAPVVPEMPDSVAQPVSPMLTAELSALLPLEGILEEIRLQVGADPDRPVMRQAPALPAPEFAPDLPPMAHPAPPQRLAPRLELRRPPHGNDDRMSLAELRYCHAEFMTLERMPEFISGEAAQRAMLFRALEHVSRCEGGSFLPEEMEQVKRELRNYDFASDAKRFAGEW